MNVPYNLIQSVNFTFMYHFCMEKFKCDICQAYFGQKFNLNRHVGTVHEEKKQFECKVCNSKFTQKANLNRHVTIVLKGSKQFKCEVCNTKFGD